MKLIAFIITLTAAGLASGSSVNILDQGDEPISSIVEQVCWHTSGTSKQISKISTVTHIGEYLSSLPTDHKLAACSKLYLNSVLDLVKVVSISKSNVCSQEKIAAIQQFHRGYILKGSQRTGKTPKVLATFFMHYVSLISDFCAKETATFLGALSSSQPEADTEEVDKLLDQLTGRTGVSSSSSLQYSDMFLVWSMVDMIPKRYHQSMDKYLFEGEKRIVMVAKNSDALMKMQQLCHNKVKPLYSYTLLSTIKLIDMGFYPQDSSLLNQLNHNREARRFYELTKLCEVLLPVRVVEQAAQTSDSEIVLLSRDEVEKLGLSDASQQEPEVVSEGCGRCSMDDVDIVASVTSGEAVPLAKRIKSNIKSRKSSVSRLLRMFVTNVKASLSSKLKRLFGGEEALESIENLDDNQLDIYQVSEEYEEEDLEGNLARSRRDVKNILQTLKQRLRKMIWALLCFIWAYVTILFLFPLGVLYNVFAWITGLKYDKVGYFLMTGGGFYE